MIQRGFTAVILSLLGALFVALIVLTWRNGYYFDFRKVWTAFSQYAEDTSLNWRKSFDDIKRITSILKEFKTINLPKVPGLVILKLVNWLVNFFIYEFKLLLWVVMMIVEVIGFVFNILQSIFELIGALISIAFAGWTKFGEGGFIPSDDYYNFIPLFLNII